MMSRRCRAARLAGSPRARRLIWPRALLAGSRQKRSSEEDGEEKQIALGAPTKQPTKQPTTTSKADQWRPRTQQSAYTLLCHLILPPD